MPAISIIALNDPVGIVHIPITSADSHSTRLYWTIEQAPIESTEFFNVTSNRIEIAIFASTDLINAHWIVASEEHVKVSSTWRVFEISSGDVGDTGNYDSPHLRHVSAPLARAGISILYQSSYFTDFLLVKEVDFDRASTIFASQGWQVDPTGLPRRRRSQIMSPTTPSASSGSPSSPSSASPPPLVPEITVLPSPLGCVGFSKSSEGATSEKVRQLLVWPQRARELWMRRGQGEHSERTPEKATLERPFMSYTRTEDGASLLTELSVLRGMFTHSREGGGLGIDELALQGDMWECASEVECDDSEDEQDDGPDGFPPGDESEGAVLGLSTPPPESRGRALSLPLTPRDSPGPGQSADIPIQWSGRTLRSSTGAKNGPCSQGDSKVAKREVSGDRERAGGRKRCLQLDLRGVTDGDEGHEVYHLDKSGLVTQFSDLLSTSSIKMLYSSTFHTANILVEGGDVRRAKKVLSHRRRSGYFNLTYE